MRLALFPKEEQAEVDTYVATNLEARLRLEELLETADFLSYDAVPLPPSPEIKANLMARVQMDKQITVASQPTTVPAVPTFGQRLLAFWQQFRLSPALPALAGVAVVVALFTLGQLGRMRGETAVLQAETADLRSQVEQQQTIITNLEIDLAEQIAQVDTQQNVG